jgi:plastocyanin
MRSTLGVAACAAAVALVIPATSYADKTVTAETVWMFDSSEYTIDQGEKLTFSNMDAVSPGPHNVTANTSGSDGKPLFASKTIPNGQAAPVDGAQQLKTGSYDFICTVHPFMQATLKVTDKGTPLPPPGSPQGGSPQQQPPEQQPQQQQSADTTRPSIRASLQRATLRSSRLTANVTTNELVTLRLSLTARLRGRTRTLGSATVVDGSPGRPVPFGIKLTPSARKALRRQRRATVSLVVQATDNAGNKTTARARRNLRR